MLEEHRRNRKSRELAAGEWFTNSHSHSRNWEYYRDKNFNFCQFFYRKSLYFASFNTSYGLKKSYSLQLFFKILQQWLLLYSFEGSYWRLSQVPSGLSQHLWWINNQGNGKAFNCFLSIVVLSICPGLPKGAKFPYNPIHLLCIQFFV